MKSFAYTTAASPSSAAELLGKNGRYLAGGIDLLGEMKEYIVSPERVVNIKGLSGTTEITRTQDSTLRIGANCSIANLASNEEVQMLFPALSEAAAEVGSPQIRAVATVGGNLAQHSRCWYYRQRDLTCLKRGGNTCYARDGQNKYSAVFSGNPCISPVVSNLGVALAVFETRVVVWRSGKEMRLTVGEFYQDAWFNPLAQNSLRPGDLVLAVELSLPVAGSRSSYLQVSEKSDFDWALVSCAASGKVEDGKFRGVKVALGAVAPVPFQIEEAHVAMEGRTFDGRSAEAMAAQIVEKATPFSQNAYKIPIARTLIRRTLMNLLK